MVTRADFPRTENVGDNHLDKKVSDIVTSQSIRIYQPSYAISSHRVGFEVKVFGKQSFYERIEPQWRRRSRQVVAISGGEALRQDCTKASMLRVSPKVAILSFPPIPVTSPIHPLQSLETGWDGYWAEPLSQEVLFRANQLWRKIEQVAINRSNLPAVQAAANGSVAFTWSHDYPEKELEIWLYDQPNYYAEWMLSFDDRDEENIARSQTELLRIVKQYQES